MVEAARAGLRVESACEGRVRRLVLDAGKGNVLDGRVLDALCAAAEEAGASPGVCALVLDHAGPHFSFGASVEEHLPGEVDAMLARLHGTARALLDADVPILAAVRGLCLGGGLEVVALADRVLVAPDAKLGQPELNLGVFAPLGSVLLPRLVGASAAADLLLSGRTIDAAEAVATGLAAEVVDDPGAAAVAWAEAHLVNKSAAAVRHATRALRNGWRSRFDAELAGLEHLYLDELMETRDAREGLAAFLEKRAPRWEDR